MSNSTQSHLNVAIVGAGPAGLSAALWCEELGLSYVVLESASEAGGQLLQTYNKINNHLGADAANGREMRDIFLRNLEKTKPNFRFLTNVESIDCTERRITLSNSEVFTTDSVVIATGIRRRKLNLPNEEAFLGNGILSSGKRDAHLTAGKNVCVIGGGDAALENVAILSEVAESVTLVHRSSQFRARSEFIAHANDRSNVRIMTDASVTELHGDSKLDAVTIRSQKDGACTTIPVDFLLVRIGVEPSTSLVRDQLALDDRGYIQVNSSCETSVSRVFAAGDVANPASPTISTAVGMGATAIKALFESIR